MKGFLDINVIKDMKLNTPRTGVIAKKHQYFRRAKEDTTD